MATVSARQDARVHGTRRRAIGIGARAPAGAALGRAAGVRRKGFRRMTGLTSAWHRFAHNHGPTGRILQINVAARAGPACREIGGTDRVLTSEPRRRGSRKCVAATRDEAGVVVLGMGRSGTSAMTAMFVRAGFFAGTDKDLLPANEANLAGTARTSACIALTRRCSRGSGGLVRSSAGCGELEDH